MSALTNTLKYLDNLKEIVEQAKKDSMEFFAPKTCIEKARIIVGNKEHILVGAKALVNFYESATKLFGVSLAKDFLYRLGENLGISEAETMFKAYKLEDQVMQCWERCLYAPYSLMALGLARLDILLFDVEMKDGFLLLCETKNSVFVEIMGGKVKTPICSMIAGYLNGWYKVATGRRNLVTREIMCRAAGDDVCRFITGKIKKMSELVKREDLKKPSNEYPVIEFKWK